MRFNIVFTKILKYLSNIIITIFSISCIFPFFWVMYSSFKTEKEFSLNIMSLPNKIHLENYIATIFKGEVHIALLNSLIISIFTVILVILVGFITGYLISRFEFPGKKFLYGLVLAGMLVPVHGLLVPVFIQFNKLNLYNTRVGLIIVYVTLGLPITIFLIESFIKSIPIEIEEAAVVDGSTIMQRMFRIIMPICKPVLSTSLILTFLTTWNEFPFALVLTRSSNLRTIPLWLTQFSGGQYSTNYPQLMASMVIASIPVIIIYLAFYNKVIQGMTAGAVKG
ncbi:MAG: carbohydrate ABC transporter permease [Halothermotrichaceae bacterium]